MKLKRYDHLLYRNMDSLTFCSIDIEATGSIPENNSIIEIAAVKIAGGKVIESFTSLVKSHDKIPFYVKKLTGITESMVEHAPSLEVILPQFKKFIGNSVLIGHDIDFDYKFISYKLVEVGLEPLDSPTICTLRLSGQLFPELIKKNLTFLSEHFNIPFDNHHRALHDARLTAELFLKFLDKLQEMDLTVFKDLIMYQKSRLFGPAANSHIKRHEIFDSIPEGQGIFSFKTVSGKTIHMEKCSDLKKRVSEIFFSGRELLPDRIASKIVDLKFFVSSSEEENDYIFEKYYKKYFPHDKLLQNQLIYIKVSPGRNLPRIYHTKYFDPYDTENIYLGPFVSRRECEHFIKQLVMVFPIRRCNKSLATFRDQKTCNRCGKSCVGICRDLENAENYGKIYHILQGFVNGSRISAGEHKNWLIENISENYQALSLKQITRLNAQIIDYYRNIHFFMKHNFILRTSSMEFKYLFVIVKSHLYDYFRLASEYNENKVNLEECKRKAMGKKFLQRSLNRKRFYVLPENNREVLNWLEKLNRYYNTESLILFDGNE